MGGVESRGEYRRSGLGRGAVVLGGDRLRVSAGRRGLAPVGRLSWATLLILDRSKWSMPREIPFDRSSRDVEEVTRCI